MRALWIEAGDMSGGSRNQIEFDEDLGRFFGIQLPAVGASTQLSIDVTGKRWHECSLAAKKTTYGVIIYRLNLPTATNGGFDYPGTVLKFVPAGGRYFRVIVAEQGSADHQAWRAEASNNGTIARTGGAGGREFGYSDE
jgi:hypothetical protein